MSRSEPCAVIVQIMGFHLALDGYEIFKLSKRSMR